MKNKFLRPFRLSVFSILICLLCFINTYAGDSSICLDCHEGLGESLSSTPHELSNGEAKHAIAVSCQDCHSGWQEHVDNPSRENIDAGAEMSQMAQASICGSCHLTPHQAAAGNGDPHFNSDLNCSSCHSIHGNSNRSLVKEDLNNFCISCHSSAAMEFQQRSAHPLESGNIRCVDCHDLSGISAGEFNIGFDWTCQNCHEEKAGPYLYEHPVTYDHLVEGGSCTECHNPHGSVNDRLLTQNETTLCLQCHNVPPGHTAAHSGLGSKFGCITCHSEIHGSFSNSILLDPDLGNKMFPDCYQTGCHSVGN